VQTGENFEKLNESRSLFHWLSRGSGELFRQMPFVMRTRNRHGSFFHRDAAAISFACKEANDRFFAPTFWEAMAGLDFDFTVVADLGSGSGDRLAQIVQRYPGTRGVGIDIAPAAIDFARSAIAEAGLSEKISFVTDDIRFATPRPEYQDVELLTCFMMGHDFWPREQCVTSLRRLRDAFPNARRLLLGDTARTVGVPDDDYPVFSLGFEVGHDLMGVYLPTLDEWEGVFEEGGWRLAGKRLFHLPSSGFVFELDRLA
jgi:hypothetical protein